MSVQLGVWPQQYMRWVHRASCLAHKLHGPPYAPGSSSGSAFLREAGMNVLALLIRDKRAPVVI